MRHDGRTTRGWRPFFFIFPFPSPLFSLFNRRFIIAFYSNHLENLRFVVAISVKKKRKINKTKEERNRGEFRLDIFESVSSLWGVTFHSFRDNYYYFYLFIEIKCLDIYRILLEKFFFSLTNISFEIIIINIFNTIAWLIIIIEKHISVILIQGSANRNFVVRRSVDKIWIVSTTRN